MSVETNELTSEDWTSWQGRVIRDAFPLGRFLGCSDHSGVFLTRSAALGPSDLAIKLVPADRALTETLLPRWKRAGAIVHPNLLRMLQWGGCQLDGLPYLYVVMEYADQTLAQVLERRALTDDEAREMLRPVLDALAFLHGQSLVAGQLKPANILAVGDQLKLTSDTIRRVGEAPMSAGASTPYDPPEARGGSHLTAGDIWALGICLVEALTKRAPSGSGERSEAVTLPADFSPAFQHVVARCLSLSPQSRPSAAQLVAWVSGNELELSPAALVPPVAAAPEPAPRPVTPPPATREAAARAPSAAKPSNARTAFIAVVGAVLILALGWIAVRKAGSHRVPAPPPVSEGPQSVAPVVAAPVSTDGRGPGSVVSPPTPAGKTPAASALALDEVIPEVPSGARGTIRGHIEVWVRVIVEKDGSVFATIAERSGPSRYFQRLAIEAAKKWRFPPSETPARRLIQIRFDFSRGGTMARAFMLP